MNRQPSILIVEDDRESLNGLMAVMAHAGYRVTGAGTFEDARRALADAPDLLLTKIRLGAYNGLQLIVRGRTLNPALRAIVVTGHPDVVIQREAERLHALHLTKPVDAGRLLRAVADLMAAPATPPRQS